MNANIDVGAVVVDRTQFIGGSDIAAILGLSRYGTPLSVWAEKTGAIPKKEGPKSLRMKLGTRMEEVIAELWMEETNKVLQRVTERRVHPQYPYFRAQIDRIVINEDATWEGKNTNWRLKKDWAEGEVPQEALCQAMWGLAITGKKHCYVTGLIDNEELRSVKIDRDPVLIAEMLKRADDFWNKFVVPQVMPGQVSASDADTIRALFPQSEPQTLIDLGDAGARLIESRNALYQDQIALEKEIDTVENELKLMLKEKEGGTAGKWMVTWKSQVSKRLDTALLKNNEPEIYQKYTKETPSRVFRIKELKNG